MFKEKGSLNKSLFYIVVVFSLSVLHLVYVFLNNKCLTYLKPMCMLTHIYIYICVYVKRVLMRTYRRELSVPFPSCGMMEGKGFEFDGV
jgi:hypothetical protein